MTARLIILPASPSSTTRASCIVRIVMTPARSAPGHGGRFGLAPAAISSWSYGRLPPLASSSVFVFVSTWATRAWNRSTRNSV